MAIRDCAVTYEFYWWFGDKPESKENMHEHKADKPHLMPILLRGVQRENNRERKVV